MFIHFKSFFHSAKYSNSYANGNPKCIFIVKVLLGNTALGNSSTVTPPPNW